MPCRDRNTCDGGGRGRKHQRTGTGRDQHCQHRLGILSDKPGQRRDQQDQHHVTACVTLQQTRDRRLGTLRALHQRDDLAQRGLITDAGHFNAQQAVQIDGATEHLDPDDGFQRDRFAGDRRRIQTGLPGQHPTVRRNAVARPHLHLIAGFQRRVINLAHTAVGAQQTGLAAGQASQRFDGLLRADHTALFQHMAEDHDDRQQRGGHQVTGGPGTEHRQRDQLVGDAVQARMPQAVPAGADHRYCHQQ